jgi:hypothetical protein
MNPYTFEVEVLQDTILICISHKARRRNRNCSGNTYYMVCTVSRSENLILPIVLVLPKAFA